MMEAARTSETSVDNYFTRQYIPEDKSELHTRRRENLKSHTSEVVIFRKKMLFQNSFHSVSSVPNIKSVVIKKIGRQLSWKIK
jgi:hypothetical protein